MWARMWPTPTGMLAAAATAVGIHATTFLTAVFTAVVGAAVSGFGFYLQWKWKQGEHAKDDIIREKDVQIKWLYTHLEEARSDRTEDRHQVDGMLQDVRDRASGPIGEDPSH